MTSKADILASIEDLKAKAEAARMEANADREELKKAYEELGDAMGKIYEPDDGTSGPSSEGEPATNPDVMAGQFAGSRSVGRPS